MQVDVRFGPAFATLFVTLSPGESLVAEAGAMASMESGIAMRTRFNGGFFRALLKRFFGGESLFVNEFYVPQGGKAAQLVLTQATPGDVRRVDLTGGKIYLQPGAFIACGPGIKLGVGWAGFRSMIAKEGLFRLVARGTGPVFFGGYGGILEKEIRGEYVVDTGHLIAYEPTVTLSLGLAGGIFSSFFGGEGIVSRMRGQGKIYLQTRHLPGLASWTNHHIV